MAFALIVSVSFVVRLLGVHNDKLCQPMYLMWFNAEGLLLALKQDPAVAHLAAVYLRWMSLGLPGMKLFLVISSLLINCSLRI